MTCPTGEAAEILGVLNSPKDHMQANFVKYQRDGQHFQWSEVGMSGMTLVRRCVHLQHILRNSACASEDFLGAALLMPSGAALCMHLMKTSEVSASDSLERTASAFLAASWTELRQAALTEIRAYGALMQPLQETQVDLGAAQRALQYMRTRYRLWIALHSAPADLLGDVNEASAAALAPETYSHLRSAVTVLLDAWQSGVAQLGRLLAESVGSDAGGRLSEAPGPEWLRCWRLYLVVHRHLQVWLGSSPAGQTAPATSVTCSVPHAATSTSGLTQPPGAAACVAPSHAVPALGRRQGDLPCPLRLLSEFTSGRARQAASVLRPFVAGDRGGQRLVGMLRAGWEATSVVSDVAGAADQQLQSLWRQTGLQLRQALEEELVEGGPDPREKRTSSAAASCSDNGSDTHEFTPPVSQAVRPGPGHQPAVQGRLSAPIRIPSSSGLASGRRPNSTTRQGVFIINPQLQREGHLYGNPGQIAFNRDLAAAATSVLGKQPGCDIAAPPPRHEPLLAYTTAAALVGGMCTFFHQLNTQLAAMHCRCSLEADATQTSDARSGQGMHDGFTLVTQLVTEPWIWRVEASARIAGTAALAEDGFIAHVPMGYSATSALAARRAASILSAAEGTLCSSSSSRTGGEGSAQVPQNLPAGAAAAPVLSAPESESPAMQHSQTAAWVGSVERRALELVTSPGAAAAAADGANELVPRAATSAQPHAASDAAASSTDPSVSGLPLLHLALLLAAGRVMLLGAALSAPGRDKSASGAARPDMPRWQPFTLQAQQHSTPPGDTIPMPSAFNSHQAPLAARTVRCLMHMALISCAAAANRIASVVAVQQTLGLSPDLKALCVAHSDALSLKLAVDKLLTIAQGLCRHHNRDISKVSLPAAGERHASRTGYGTAEPGASHRGVRLECSSAAGSSNTAGHMEDCEGATEPLLPRRSAAAAAAKGRLHGGTNSSSRDPVFSPPKRSWGRSLGRIMPSLVTDRRRELAGRQAAGAGLVREADRQPPEGPGPPLATRGCWAGDPVEPLTLTSPSPLCSLPRQDMLEAEPASYRPKTKALHAAVYASAGSSAPPRSDSWPGGGLLLDSSSRLTSADGAGGVGEGGKQSSTSLQRGSKAVQPWRTPVGRCSRPVWTTAVDAGLVEQLQGLAQRLHDMQAAGAGLLLREVGSRAAVLFRNEGAAKGSNNGKSSSNRGAVAVVDGGSATQQVMAKLLHPLRDALAGLHPSSQAQLLAGNFTAVLCLLQQEWTGEPCSPVAWPAFTPGGSSGTRAAPRGHRRGGARTPGSAERLGKDLDILEIELRQAWEQLGLPVWERSLGDASMLGQGSRAQGGDEGVRSQGIGAVARRDVETAREELEAKLRALREQLVGAGWER